MNHIKPVWARDFGIGPPASPERLAMAGRDCGFMIVGAASSRDLISRKNESRLEAAPTNKFYNLVHWCWDLTSAGPTEV